MESQILACGVFTDLRRNRGALIRHRNVRILKRFVQEVGHFVTSLIQLHQELLEFVKFHHRYCFYKLAAHIARSVAIIDDLILVDWVVKLGYALGYTAIVGSQLTATL